MKGSAVEASAPLVHVQQSRQYSERFTYRLLRVEREDGRTVHVYAKMDGDTIVDYSRQYV